MSDIVRCPFWVLEFEFRPRIAHVDGKVHLGQVRAHNARPRSCGLPVSMEDVLKIENPDGVDASVGWQSTLALPE